MPIQPACKGLFRPHLFKAKTSTRLGTTTMGLDVAGAAQDPVELLFSEPATKVEVIPVPNYF